MRLLVSFIISTGIVAANANMAFAGCSGIACADLVVQQQANCFVLQNKNPRQNIKVTASGNPPEVYYIPANGQITPPSLMRNGACHQTWWSSWSADYN